MGLTFQKSNLNEGYITKWERDLWSYFRWKDWAIPLVPWNNYLIKIIFLLSKHHSMQEKIGNKKIADCFVILAKFFVGCIPSSLFSHAFVHSCIRGCGGGGVVPPAFFIENGNLHILSQCFLIRIVPYSKYCFKEHPHAFGSFCILKYLFRI